MNLHGQNEIKCNWHVTYDKIQACNIIIWWLSLWYGEEQSEPGTHYLSIHHQVSLVNCTLLNTKITWLFFCLLKSHHAGLCSLWNTSGQIEVEMTLLWCGHVLFEVNWTSKKKILSFIGLVEMDKDVDDFYKTRRLSLISSHPYKVWLPAYVFHLKKITRVNVKKMLVSDFEINMHVHAVDASCSFLFLWSLEQTTLKFSTLHW